MARTSTRGESGKLLVKLSSECPGTKCPLEIGLAIATITSKCTSSNRRMATVIAESRAENRLADPHSSSLWIEEHRKELPLHDVSLRNDRYACQQRLIRGGLNAVAEGIYDGGPPRPVGKIGIRTVHH